MLRSHIHEKISLEVEKTINLLEQAFGEYANYANFRKLMVLCKVIIIYTHSEHGNLCDWLL